MTILPKVQMTSLTPTPRNNRFADAELVCELLQQEVEMSAAWEKCYPYYDETSHFWPEYLIAQERYAAVERFALLDNI
jgi:hypothetical protein